MAYVTEHDWVDRLEDSWLAILDVLSEPVPFIHPLWQREWMNSFGEGREPLLLAVRDGERIVGVAPLLRDGGRLSFIGDHSLCDYMDFVVRPGVEDEFFASLLPFLASETGTRELEMRGLRDGSPTLAAVAKAAERLALEVDLELEAVAPRLELPPTWDDYLTVLTRKDRHELRRKLRRLSQYGEARLSVLTSPEETSQGMDTLLLLMTTSLQDKAAFLTEQMERFLRRIVAALSTVGLVRLYLLRLDSRVVASVLGFDMAGCLYMFNSGYDPEYSSLSVGIVSKAFCLRDAIELGRRQVDFLRGDEAYKYDLGGEDRSIYRCVVRWS